MTVLKPVQIAELPASVEGFVELRDQIATSPQGGATMMVVALLLYGKDEELGQACLAVAADRSRLQEGAEGYKGWQLRRSDLRRIRSQLGRQDYLPRTYLKNCQSESGYQMPVAPYVLEFTANAYSGDPDSGPYKIFVACSGAASPRPVTVRLSSRGVWKAYEWSSLLVGVQGPPPDPAEEL